MGGRNTVDDTELIRLYDIVLAGVLKGVSEGDALRREDEAQN